MLAAALFILSISEPYESMMMQSVLPSLRKGDSALGENSDRRQLVQSGECTIANSDKQPGSACKCLSGFTGEITWNGTKHSGQCISKTKYAYYYYYMYGDVPECTNPPTKPENGDVVFSNGNYEGSEATFTCKRGYNSGGTPKIECKIVDNANTPWPAPDSAPACTPECAIANSNKQTGPACKCLPGFTGEITWNGTTHSGECTNEDKYQCTDPPYKLENGDVVFSNASQHGSVATFSCKSEYELVGSVSITCEATSPYTPWPLPNTIPRCILKVICGDGIVQGAEQCECNSNGNDCRHCKDCKLAQGKECTPDGSGSQAEKCCSESGMFIPANTTCNVDESTQGYCSGGFCVRADECDFEVDGQRLGKFCGVSDINPCALKCGTESTCYDTAAVTILFATILSHLNAILWFISCLCSKLLILFHFRKCLGLSLRELPLFLGLNPHRTSKQIDTSPKLLKPGSVCMYGSAQGTCVWDLCIVKTECGNGLLQEDEECECASGTECRFCSNCKLQDGKECTPDSATACCDDEGMFLTTAASCVMPHGSSNGYCNRGVCASLDRECKLDFMSGTDTVNLNQFCGVASTNPCKGKCGSSASPDICLEPEALSDADTNLADGAFCMMTDGRGECVSGTCLKAICGDGVLEYTEDCECESGETECRYCSQCKLDSGGGNSGSGLGSFGVGQENSKECTPDSVDPTTAACCDDQGMFATTSAQCTMPSGDRGYCNAGVCSTFKCRINLELRTGEKLHLDTFCGVSELNSCSAMCESSATNTCYDPVDTWLEVESLADGAFCAGNGFRGTCVSGECKPSQEQQMFLSIYRTNPPTVPVAPPVVVAASYIFTPSEGADNKVQLLPFLLGIAFVFYQVE